MVSLPVWIQIAAAVGPSIVGIAVAVIAYQQWQTNRDAFREKLFDRRMEVFGTVHKALSECVRSLTSSRQTIDDLASAWQSTQFLFGPDMQAYVDEVRRRCIDLQKMRLVQDQDPAEAQRLGYTQQTLSIAKWMDAQLQDGLWRKFAPYLSFGNRR